MTLIIGLWHVSSTRRYRSICSDWRFAINQISYKIKLATKHLSKRNSTPKFLEDRQWVSWVQTNKPQNFTHENNWSLQLSVFLFSMYWFFSKSVIFIFGLWQWKMCPKSNYRPKDIGRNESFILRTWIVPLNI